MAAERSEVTLQEYRRAHVPLYNDQPLKLGLFNTNCSFSNIMSDTPSNFKIEWNHSLAIGRKADELGFEVLLPVARWRGFGGRLDFNGTSFEPFTYAAAMAASTKTIMTMATCHLPLIHPLVAAKMSTTIDHISGGRFGLNVVMGWFEPEMRMFGVELRPHDDRYGYGAEWVQLVEKLWTEPQPFDSKSQYFNLAECRSFPAPVQPKPVLVNAGNSPAGLNFSACHMDFNLASFPTLKDGASYVEKLRNLARDKYQRDIGVLTSALVICRDTEEEARAAYQSILDHGDWGGAEEALRVLRIQSESFNSHQKTEFLSKFVAGFGGFALVGTPSQVANYFQQVHDSGIAGLLLGMIDYEAELPYFERHVMPLLRERGLRI